MDEAVGPDTVSAFESACVLRVLDDSGPRPRLVLLEPLVYRSDLLGTSIVVPPGFDSDGASIPRTAMSITGYPGLRAAIVHDWLLKTALDRRLADAVFREALSVCGVESHIADTMHMAVAVYTQLVTRPPALGDDEERVTA